jgi:hypothetical protein
MARLSWLAVWSESKNSEFASLLKETWSRNERLRKRVIVEVVGRMADALGSYFALSEVCPFFYLRGRENSWDAMPEREKRRARDEQIDALNKLRSGTLIFFGFTTANEIMSIVADEIPAGETPVRFVVAGLSAAEQEILAKQVSTLKPIQKRAFSIVHGDIQSFFRRNRSSF